MVLKKTSPYTVKIIKPNKDSEAECLVLCKDGEVMPDQIGLVVNDEVHELSTVQVTFALGGLEGE